MTPYEEIQTYIDNLIVNRTHLIEDIIYSWFKASQQSPMFISDINEMKVIDMKKAENHLSLVNIYNDIFSRSFPFTSQKIYKPEFSLFNVKYAEKALKEYQHKIQNESDRKDSYNEFIKMTNDKLISMGLKKFNVEQINNDFYKDRIMIKKVFKKLFSFYGIDLQEKVLDNLFGKIKKQGSEFDTILFFTQNTSFHKSLNAQFNTTQMGEASGIFSAFFMRAAGKLEKQSNEYIVGANKNNAKDCNPFLKEKAVIKILATAHACCI